MGLKKPGAVAEQPISAAPAVAEPQAAVTEEAPKQESGATAALGRLANPALKKQTTNPAYKARDYEAEAIGKTRCVQFEAALMSPAIAGMRFDTMEQYLALVKQAAEAGVAFSFEK